jgi:TolB-like protein/DNA-binding winged helix-turn-helix (wHTH) protein
MSQAPTDAPANGGEIFVVGDLRVDVGQQRVTRSDAEIALPNLSFQLLVALIRAAPDVLSHDELMARVWPGLVVGPETLHKRANLLREALGDGAKESRYISAVRSRGYRLVAEVRRTERLAASPAAQASQAMTVTPDNGPPRPDIARSETQFVSTMPGAKRWLGLGLFAVAVLAIGIVARTTIRMRAANSSAEFSKGTDAPIGTRALTVAVMPFENISADANDAYLARGLPEMILNRLSRVTGLTVIARNSSFALSTASIDSGEIGRRLNSGYLVSGSVQRKADRLRMTVQLVDTTAGTLVWSATFDRDVNDIFAIEDEIAEQVTGALSARLGGLEPAPPAQARSGNVEAYLAYLRGRTLLGRLSVAESDAAAPFFEKAISLDPNFAAAYASLYDARMQAADLRYEDLAPYRQRYRPLIDRALAIDPHSGAAYFARAMWADTPFDARNADFRRGVALDPSNGRGLTAYAEFLDPGNFGRIQSPRAGPTKYPPLPEEAKRILQRALQIDPMSPAAHFDAAAASFGEGGGAMLEHSMLSVLELDPNFVPALNAVGLTRWVLHDRLTEAVQILEHAIALDPGNTESRHTAMAVYLDLGEERAAREVAAGTPQIARDVHMRLMYAGDWRAAGRAAYDETSSVFDSCANWLTAEAVRDYALKTGELSRAIAFINVMYEFDKEPAAHLDFCNIGAAIALSQLSAAQGHAPEAQALRRAVISWLEANTAKYAGPALRQWAGALLLDGRKDAALDKLAESFRSGGDYMHWWYTLKYDPVWQPLHGDPRFQAIAADVQRHVDSERKALEELRRHGDVPEAQRPHDSARKP